MILVNWQVRDALNITKEHKRALVQAEKLEQEFVALVTGKKHTDTKSTVSCRCGWGNHP